MKVQLPQPVLVDKRNLVTLLPGIVEEISKVGFVGLDCETEDSGRHDGLKKFCREKPDGRTSRTVFDMRRTTMTGFSVWPHGCDRVFYVNLHHADEPNRLDFDEVRDILDALPPDAYFVAHNAPFELTAFRLCHGYDLTRVICSMQMAVSAYGPDEYRLEDFAGLPLAAFRPVMDDLIAAGATYEGQRDGMTPLQADVFAKITGKASEAKHSYNGYVGQITYGYGLKQAILSWFDYEMTTYESALGGKVHMGQLTGEEVVRYGCDDAYWCLRLFDRLLEYMNATNPALITTFFEQEAPMSRVFADLWWGGLRVDERAITRRLGQERANAAGVVRRLRRTVRALLPFSLEPNTELAGREPWYAKNWEKYRQQIETWAGLVESDDDFHELYALRGAVSNAWATEQGLAEPSGLNLGHYMPQRVLLYDLIGAKPVISDRKVSSDGEARGKLKERLTDPNAVEVIDCLNALAGIEQRVKLFLTPYTQLTDPETGRLYPVISSRLATRRMASRHPNGMQLAKRGESAYVRGFFRGDADDHVVLSTDWSGIELVLIGELSGDPGFVEAFGQLPHKDIHSGAAASVLSRKIPKLTKELFKALPGMTREQAVDLIGPQILVNVKGEPMEPAAAYKYWRTEVGKGSNFSFWFSGALSQVAEKLGWTADEMWEAVEGYREEFPVAEAWRVRTVAEACEHGFVRLPDGHRRVRPEATETWLRIWTAKWAPLWESEPGRANPGFGSLRDFVRDITRAIQTRARNQSVNAMIQGSCATLAKRSIIRVRKRFGELGWSDRDCRFMIPIHDELVFSVRHDRVVDAIREIKRAMCDHPDLFSKCKLDASPSVGLTFEPYDKTKAPYGQVELYEAPERFGGGRLDEDGVREVVEYLMDGRRNGHA